MINVRCQYECNGCGFDMQGFGRCEPALIDIIGKYESILHLPGLDIAYHCAFAQVSKAIQEGKYSKEDFKNLLKVHEDGTEETKG